MSKVLYILAGYSGVGKSTLLTHALKNKIPLFGNKHDEYFQSTRIHSHFPEWLIPGHDILKQGSWFSDMHLEFLSTQDTLPEHVVLHVDLITLQTLAFASEMIAHPGQQHPKQRTFKSLASESDNRQYVKRYLSHDVFKRFDHTVVNTLYAPWDVIARQWRNRQSIEKSPHPERAMLFDLNAPRDDIHVAIYNSWLWGVATLAPELAFISQVKDARLSIQPITFCRN